MNTELGAFISGFSPPTMSALTSHDKRRGRIPFRELKANVCIFSSFRWKLNGTEISPRSGSHYSLSGGNLRISHLNKDQDAGTYQCLASNSFGTIVSREASLTFACESTYSQSVCRQTFLRLASSHRITRCGHFGTTRSGSA